MRIVYVYPKFTNTAGTERILIDKMNYFADYVGYDVMVLTYEQDNHPIIYPLSSKVIHKDLDARFYELYRYNKVIRFIRRFLYFRKLQSRFNDQIASFYPDIVIATTYYIDIISLIKSCKNTFVRVLESHIDQRYIHNKAKFSHGGIIHRLRSWVEMRSIVSKSTAFDILVALNNNDAYDWSRYLRTIVINNIVHLNTLGRLSSQKAKRVIFVGRYTWQKGVEDLLKIWLLIYMKHPDWHLEMYGEGVLYEYLLNEAERLQSNIHVNLTTTDIFSKYVESSILLVTSNFEPFGLVMPEAMSCGLPVVAFDCPSGPANIITDGVDGYLIKNRDVLLFADKVCALIESPLLRKKMGCAAVDSSKRFSPERIMPKWEQLFHDLLNARRK